MAIDVLEKRVTALETGMSGAQDSLADIDRKQDEQMSALISIQKALGDSPDDATGTPGSGMRGQLSDIVQREKAEAARRAKSEKTRTALDTWVKIIAGMLAGGATVAGILKAIGGH